MTEELECLICGWTGTEEDLENNTDNRHYPWCFGIGSIDNDGVGPDDYEKQEKIDLPTD